MFFVYLGPNFTKISKNFEWPGLREGGGGRGKGGVTLFVTALGDTNPSDATG